MTDRAHKFATSSNA